ncbi:restriction endonuclease subunit S [Streptomyces sudanensis]|uniref:restriction endonuclease subunit S n=1 Tax=Streptomyces sudanensis TaxID=436397 RepID=UPI0020CC93F2|nr:restriction endonuclease subunit S [Streptomyces sudanensis]MCP9957345.1 restriction endonuclease subunit S [Streptomyces sudanensis]MCQ0002101.1 restriction endonuclease subunit S [Streptomyces sudanensis]
MSNAYVLDFSALDAAPAHWDRRPLWTLIRRRDVTGRPDAELLSVYRDHGVVPKSSRDDNFNKPSEDLSSYRYVRPGDLVLNKMKTWQGSLAVSQYEGIVSPAYFVCDLSPEVHPRFAHHLLRSRPYIHLYQAASKGIRPNQWDLPFEDFRALPMLLPPLEEQRRIADFLDAETARIDKLVRLRSKQLSLIGEGLAVEAVSLTGRSQIRRGGGAVEDVTQLRRAAISTQTGSTPANLHDLSDGSASEGGIPWYTPAAIDPWMSITGAEKATHRDGIPLFPAGSVVITGIGESLGKIAYLDHVATGNQQLTAITPQVGVSGRFMAWQLWAAEREIREWAQYSRIRIINNDSLKSFPIYLPSRSEQDKVVRALDSHMARVRQITDAFLKFQRLADERRQALITATVTGQFDVSTASGRNVTDGVTA